jgi:hypothetical protein
MFLQSLNRLLTAVRLSSLSCTTRDWTRDNSRFSTITAVTLVTHSSASDNFPFLRAPLQRKCSEFGLTVPCRAFRATDIYQRSNSKNVSDSKFLSPRSQATFLTLTDTYHSYMFPRQRDPVIQTRKSVDSKFTLDPLRNFCFSIVKR